MDRQHDYGNKPADYFHNARSELRAMLPASCERVLELGCGSGATLAWIKALRPTAETVGVELFSDAAEQARAQVDRVICGDIEKMDLGLPLEHFDLILCMDVLEHLVDPWAVMQRLATHLKPGGRLIASIPNVRNWHALLPLLLAGRWEYRDAGILDKTHLRFFTKASARALVECGGLRIAAMQRLPLQSGGKSGLANAATLGLFRDFLTLQFLIAADKPVAAGVP